MEKIFEFNPSPSIETNLVGYIRQSSEAIKSVKKEQEFLIELESVMTKYKVVSINAAFDVFKMQNSKKNES